MQSLEEFFNWYFYTTSLVVFSTEKKTVQNPWRSNTLEWTAPIKHIHGNWEGEIPHVYRWPYDYSKPGHDEDFVPQNVPMKEGEEQLHH